MLAALAGRLPVVSYEPGSTRTLVVTTYLDSPARDYLAIVEGTSGGRSLKVRVREYMPLYGEDSAAARLTPGPSCFLERKERVGELRTKQRIELAKVDVARVLRRELELTGEPSVVRALRGELDSRELKPVLVSVYRRRVFGSDHGLRVTFDDQLGFHRPPDELYGRDGALGPALFGAPLARGPAHLLEIKEPSGAQTPPWLTELLAGLEPVERFSKFRDGMRSLRELGRVRPRAPAMSSG